MPKKEAVSTEDTKTTAALTGAGAVVAGTVVACAAENPKVGLLASLAVAVGSLLFFNQVGKQHRVADNAAHQLKDNLGLASSEDRVNNTVNNIVTGGKVVCDALSGSASGPK